MTPDSFQVMWRHDAYEGWTMSNTIWSQLEDALEEVKFLFNFDAPCCAFIISYHDTAVSNELPTIVYTRYADGTVTTT